MIRIGKMTDYGVAILTAFVRSEKKSALTARDLSRQTELPLPTVSKLLKMFCKARLLVSQRGVNGGYKLSRLPEEVSVAQIIEVLEGPIAITDCSGDDPRPCGREGICPVRTNWRQVTVTVKNALEKLTLAEISENNCAGRGLFSAYTKNSVKEQVKT